MVAEPELVRGHGDRGDDDVRSALGAGGRFIYARPDTETYLLVANPDWSAANVTIDVGERGYSPNPRFRPRAPAGSPSRCRRVAAIPPASRASARRWPRTSSSPDERRRHPHERRSADRRRAIDLLVPRRQFWAAGASTLLTPLP